MLYLFLYLYSVIPLYLVFQLCNMQLLLIKFYLIFWKKMDSVGSDPIKRVLSMQTLQEAQLNRDEQILPHVSREQASTVQQIFALKDMLDPAEMRSLWSAIFSLFIYKCFFDLCCPHTSSTSRASGPHASFAKNI